MSLFDMTLVGERPRLRLRYALRLIDQDYLLFLLVGRLLELRRFSIDLLLVQLARAVDREPFAHRHRARTCDQASKSRDEQRMGVDHSAGDAGN